MMKGVLRKLYLFATTVSVSPGDVLRRWRGIPHFARNAFRYLAAAGGSERAFPLRLNDIHYRSFDRFAAAGDVAFHYFHQDLWAAQFIYERGTREHVDVGSRVDGFVAHVLPYCRVTYVDIRPLSLDVEGFEYRHGSIVDLPFPDASIASLSCLHVIEHIGLGRYGDPVDPHGHAVAAAELSRVLKPGGTLLLGTPIGRERLCFDAHRIFDPYTVVAMFPELTLEQFGLIDDGNRLLRGARFEEARTCEYGCGLFVFTKQ